MIPLRNSLKLFLLPISKSDKWAFEFDRD